MQHIEIWAPLFEELSSAGMVTLPRLPFPSDPVNHAGTISKGFPCQKPRRV